MEKLFQFINKLESKESNKVFKALHIASILHKDQKRKFSKDPYIVHPINVAVNVIENKLDINLYIKELEKYMANIVIVALLHDTIEDYPDTDYATKLIIL